MRSTPTPLETFRMANVSFTPLPRRAMQMPSNAWRRSLSPSLTRTATRSVSPGRNGGISVRMNSFWVSMKACIYGSGLRSGPGELFAVYRLVNITGARRRRQPPVNGTQWVSLRKRRCVAASAGASGVVSAVQVERGSAWLEVAHIAGDLDWEYGALGRARNGTRGGFLALGNTD